VDRHPVADRIFDDPDFRRLVEAARDMRIPVSELLGRERVTRYFTDPLGRVVRSTTESAWTPDDREALLALMAYEDDMCPRCHHPLSETTKPENEERYVEKPYLLCHRCVAIEQAEEAHKDHRHPNAILIPVVLEEPSQLEGFAELAAEPIWPSLAD
jgi:hypothetical protein